MPIYNHPQMERVILTHAEGILPKIILLCTPVLCSLRKFASFYHIVFLLTTVERPKLYSHASGIAYTIFKPSS